MKNSSEVKIHVENLKKTFGKLEVLKDINIDITQGEVLVVIGPSGSGKSTFLRCLNRLETATSGKIIVNGENISDKKININKARENIGMVFQHFNLFPNMTVLQNVALAPVELKKMSKEEANQTDIFRTIVKAGWKTIYGHTKEEILDSDFSDAIVTRDFAPP